MLYKDSAKLEIFKNWLKERATTSDSLGLSLAIFDFSLLKDLLFLSLLAFDKVRTLLDFDKVRIFSTLL